MPKLYVANCTKQNQIVYFRLDFNDDKTRNTRFQPAKQQQIRPGRQVPLGGEFVHMMQVEDIVKQLTRHGAAFVADVPRLKRIAPYLMNIDKPVPEEAIRMVNDINSKTLVAQGRIRRQRAAVVANEAVTHAVANMAAEEGVEDDVAPAPTDVTFEQLDQSEAGESRIEEGVHVRPDGEPAAPTRGNRGRNRRR